VKPSDVTEVVARAALVLWPRMGLSYTDILRLTPHDTMRLQRACASREPTVSAPDHEAGF
jgi:hypothetical protein